MTMDSGSTDGTGNYDPVNMEDFTADIFPNFPAHYYDYIPALPSEFTIIHQNVRDISSRNKFDEIALTIDRAYTCDAFVVTETWLDEHCAPLYNIAGYEFIHVHRPTGVGGGVGVYVNNRWVLETIDVTLPTHLANCLEFLAIDLKFKDLNYIVLCIYRP